MGQKLKRIKASQDEVFYSMATLLTGISSPVRLKLIHFLSQAPLTVETLAGKIDQSVANTSMHLRKMLSCQLVTVAVMGKNRLYSLHPAARVFWEQCQDFAQNVNPGITLDVEGIYEKMTWTEPLKTTVQKAKDGKLTLIDARPLDEVAESLTELHALNIPSSEIHKYVSKIPKNKPVLVFCRGRFCGFSAYVVSELRKKGIKAFRLNESWHSLKSAC